jgi:tetratricopeptide (TPR) repeat protein/DNA-binding NarL/FixJ family response regulator
MIHKAKHFFFFLLLIITSSVFSQNRAFDSLANKLNRISNTKKAESLEILEKLYQIAYSSPDSSLFIARCLYEESILNVYKGFVDTSMSDRIEKRLSKPSLSLLEKALLQSSLGINLIALGDYSEAFTLNLQALEKYKQIGNIRFIAKTLNSLGNICSTIGLVNLAEYYYLEAITFLSPDFYEYYITKSNIFRKIAKKNEAAAVDSMLFLIETVEKSNHKDILPILYLNIGSFLLHSYPETSLEYFTKMQTIEIDNPKMTAILLTNKGEYYRIKNNYSKALIYFRDAQKILESQYDFESLSMFYSVLSQTFETLNQSDSALFYARKNEEVTRKIRSNTVAIETHQKYITTILEASQKDLTIAEQTIKLKNKQFSFIIIITSFTTLLILLFLLLINRQKRLKASENRELTAKLEHEKRVQQYETRQRKFEKEKQKEVIAAKTREITSYSLLVSNKNNLLNQIKDINTQAINKKENATKIATKIDEIIHNNLSVDKEWENFKMHFDKVHPHFFKKLKNLCKELTEENLKMSAYIKMGMTTKQIAQLLNITDRSVVTNRHRMKKKLKLADKESLSTYIFSL